MAKVMTIAEPVSRRSAAPSLKAFLSLGFRPLYLAGSLWALLAVALWVFVPQWLNPRMGALAWHAHEMLWGFIGTIALGFLLTASATWTGINPLKGRPLAMLCGMWLLARLAYLSSDTRVFGLAVVAETVVYLWSGLALWRVIRKSHSLRNYGIPWLAVGLGLANLAYLHQAWLGQYPALMQRFTLGLVVMAIIALLVARRVIPFFASRAIQGLNLPMQVGSGQLQLGLGLLAIATLLVGLPRLAGVLLMACGLVSLVQVISWKPQVVVKRPILSILYLGYTLLGLGLLTAGAWQLNLLPTTLSRMALPAHLIGMGGFSVLIIGMITRTALGHLGRALKLDTSMLCSYGLIVLAVALRLAALWPSPASAGLVHAAGACWVAAMALYIWRFGPMLIRPRPDAGF